MNVEKKAGLRKKRIALAKSKHITFLALVLEGLLAICAVLLFDAALAPLMQIPSLLSHQLPWQGLVAAYLVLQYGLIATEITARYRSETQGWTIPLVFLPFGNVLRIVLMFGLELIVIVPKLCIYFLSVSLAFITLPLRISGSVGFSPIDLFDRITEPLEMLINKLYNALYYHKIETRTNVFNAFFNNFTTLWCINN